MGAAGKKSRQAPAVGVKLKLAALENEVASLRAENARLTQELEQYIEQWETLDAPQVSTLAYLCKHGHGTAPAIARDIGANIQIVESSLVFLLNLQYVRRAAATAKSARGKMPAFSLAPKGVRYLKSRGLHK